MRTVFLRFAFFLSIRYSVVSCVGCFIYDSKKTTDLIRINLNFCVLYIWGAAIATFWEYISRIHLNPYICIMKKEFGKWLMDIAKYLTTAVLLSSVFNDIKESWVIYLVVSVAIVLTLLTGLLLVKDKKEEKEV